MIKKILLFIVAVIGIFFYVRARLTAEKPAFTIGVECDYAPNNWEEKSPTDSNIPLVNHEGFYAEGYDIQIAKYIADQLGMTLNVKKIAWEDLLPALNRKEIDAVFSGMLDTDERRKTASFSDTYEINKTEYGVIVNRNSDYKYARTFEDLNGASFVAQKNTLLDSAIDQIPGSVHTPPVETVSEMLDKVLSGKVDAAIINVDTGQTYEKAHGNLRLIVFPEHEGFELGFNGICAAVRKDDAELLRKINNILHGLSKKDRQKIMDQSIARVWRNL